MALSADALASVIKSAVYNLEVSENAMDKMGEALASYIKENTELTFSWLGALNSSSGEADPTTSTKGEIASLDNFDLRFGDTSYNTQSSALQKFAENLQSGLKSATYNVTESGFSTSEATISSDATLPSISISIDESLSDSSEIQNEAFKQLSSCIVSWICSLSLSSVCSGSHGSYIGGTAQVVSIS